MLRFIKGMLVIALDAAEAYAKETDNQVDDLLVSLAAHALRRAFGLEE